MKTLGLLCPLVHREVRALISHRLLIIGMFVSIALGVTVATAVGSSEARMWVWYQFSYYAMPLLATLTSIMIVRQDLREGPMLALLPGSSSARVAAKALVAWAYLCLILALLVAPSAVVGGGAFLSWFLLAVGGCLVTAVFVGLGAWRGFRARHEVRAYLGGLAIWFFLLFGSGAFAYAAHLTFGPELTPAATLATLMANPLEAFRLFVFFGLGSIPMNPQTTNPIAVWWMENPLIWLTIITLPFCLLPLVHASWNLRFRAHCAE